MGTEGTWRGMKDSFLDYYCLSLWDFLIFSTFYIFWGSGLLAGTFWGLKTQWNSMLCFKMEVFISYEIRFEECNAYGLNNIY